MQGLSYMLHLFARKFGHVNKTAMSLKEIVKAILVFMYLHQVAPNMTQVKLLYELSSQGLRVINVNCKTPNRAQSIQHYTVLRVSENTYACMIKCGGSVFVFSST